MTSVFHRLPNVLLIAVASVVSVACFASRVRASEQPNIVFAFADDWGRYASAYASPERPSACDVVETPNFDRVAAEGALFLNAFVSAPSCTPSRAAIVSGRHFFRNGSHSQLHHPWVKGVPDPWDAVQGFPLMLQASSYHIGWTYKMHISEDRMGGSDHNYKSSGQRFNNFSQVVSAAEDKLAAKARLLDEVRGNFNSFLADRTDNQPFYYWFNPTNTHRPWTGGSGKAIWGIEPSDLKGKLPAFLPDNEIVREDFADYLGEAMAFDAALGVLIEELTRMGELENTLLVVSGDHGAPGFPRGKCNLYDFGTQVSLAVRWPGKVSAGTRIKTPVSLIDLAPTFLEVAGLPKAADMDGDSLLAAMGKEQEQTALRGFAIVGRENHVNESRPGGLPYPMRGIRTADYLYIINFAPDRWPVAQPPLAARLVQDKNAKSADTARRMDIDFGPTRDFFVEFETSESMAEYWQLGFGKRPAEELYRLADDPDQTHNLANDPTFTTQRQSLRKQLLDVLEQGQDPRVLGDGSAFDKPPYALDQPLRGTIEEIEVP